MSDRRTKDGGMAPPAESLPNLMSASTRLLEGWAELNGELWGFAQSTLQNGLEAAEDMRNCRSLADLAQAQMQFLRRHYEDGLDEAERVSRLMARISAEAAETLGFAGRG